MAGKLKKVLVIVNPNSGNGGAKLLYDKEIEPGVQQWEGGHLLLLTQRSGHARDYLQQELDLTTVALIIVVSGDGLFNEVINALPEWPQVPVALVPGGSSNGVWSNMPGRLPSVTESVNRLVAGKAPKTAIDLLRFQYRPIDGDDDGDKPVERLAALHISWAAVATHDVYHEQQLRWMGVMLKDLVAPLLVIGGAAAFQGKVRFLPPPEPSLNTHLQYPFDEDTYGDDGSGGWQTLEGRFVVCSVCNMAKMSGSTVLAPNQTPNSGYGELVVIREENLTWGLARLQLLRVFLSADYLNGSHVRLPFVEYFPVSKVEITPNEYSLLSVDGELVETMPDQPITIDTVPRGLDVLV